MFIWSSRKGDSPVAVHRSGLRPEMAWERMDDIERDDQGSIFSHIYRAPWACSSASKRWPPEEEGYEYNGESENNMLGDVDNAEFEPSRSFDRFKRDVHSLAEWFAAGGRFWGDRADGFDATSAEVSVGKRSKRKLRSFVSRPLTAFVEKAYEAMIRGDPEAYCTFKPNDEVCPASVQKFFGKALSPDPADRPSAWEASRHLQEIIQE